MQYRRREEEHVALSPSSKLRPQHRLDSVPEPYRRNRREGSDRSPVQQRNLSPLKVDGVRRVGGDGFEGRDFDWHLNSRRSSRVRSRSPPLAEQLRKRSHFDDGVSHRSCSPPPLGLRPRYELSKTMDYGVDDVNMDAKRVYLNREKDLVESRLDIGHGIVDQRFMRSGNDVGNSYRSIPDMGINVTSRYDEAEGKLPLPSRSVSRGVPAGRFDHERIPSRYDEAEGQLPLPSRSVSRGVPAGRFEHERIQYREHPNVDKIPITESHSREDKTMFHAGDICHSKVSPSYAKDFAGTSHLRDYGNSSIEMTRSDFLCSHGDAVCLPSSCDLPRSSGKLPEDVGLSGHSQRPFMDTTRGPDLGKRNMMCNQQCELSPTRTEHVDYFNSRSQARAVQDEHLYHYDDVPRRVAPHGRLDFEQAVMEYDNRELSRHYISHSDLDRTYRSEETHDNPRRGIMHDHPASQKPTYVDHHDHDASQRPTYVDYHDDVRRTCVDYHDHDASQRPTYVDYHDDMRRTCVDYHDHDASQRPTYVDYHDDMRRTSISSMQGEAYLHSRYNQPENAKRMANDYDVSYPGAPEADRIPILRPEYDSRREGDLGRQQERYQSSHMSKHNSETYRQVIRVQGMDQNVGTHNHSDRLVKRKYNANQEIDERDLRTMKSSKWDAAEEFQDLYERDEWVDDERMKMPYSSNNVGYKRKIYRKYKNEYSELENEEDFPSDEWISPQGSTRHGQRHSFRFQKYSNQNIRHLSKSSSSNWYKSQHFSKRNTIQNHQKQPKGWKKYHGYDENKHTTNDESYEDLVSAAESEPTEGSEEFIQMVHENFLMYSKDLNLNLSVQRRYKNQGKAGSLYCIVCGKSSSKEFMDTGRLVTHAFMSHKAGLRAKHLALHKAICVMMGWDTAIPQDTVTWVPQILPRAEALAQKEDLILWPPIVIIHNISMLDDNPKNWKVVSMETVEAFLRGKGFVRGRIKLCLGKPADQSTILVKFLGTFVGLGDAERIHKYLSDSNRGRADYEKVKSDGIKSCNMKETEDEVESILCGYVAIAEDFDKLDLNSKKRSLVKSRKEIDDLDKDPVKTNERR